MVVSYILLIHTLQDLDPANMVYSSETIPVGPFQIHKDKIYLIDFGSSRFFTDGPAKGIRINDFRMLGGHFLPPEGMDSVDPYAYDVFCLGNVLTILHLVHVVINAFCFVTHWHYLQEMADQNPGIQVPEVVVAFCDRLQDDDPCKRPTAKEALSQWRDVMASLQTHDTPKT